MNIFLKLLFLKTAFFSGKTPKNFFGGCTTILFERTGRLTTKMNITFFMRSKPLNIFLLTIFFEESNIFWENREEPFSWRRGKYTTVFWKNKWFDNKYKYNIFSKKKKKAMFSEKIVKNYFFGGCTTILFGRRGRLTTKLNITFFMESKILNIF